jgi:queuine/archaeosine tRNA-ribosyltransferase
MKINRSYQHDGYAPVVHFGRYLNQYLDAIEASPKLSSKECIALGGLVPNLLRKPKALSYEKLIDDLVTVRERFSNKHIHVFGIGGTATLHIAALLGYDSVDSSGWRNRAARGIVQLPGRGDRVVAGLGNWRGRRPTREEWAKLKDCPCPACQASGILGLRASGLRGFCNRATHNLWILLDEATWISERLRRGTYKCCYKRRLNNTIYLPVIERLVQKITDEQA